MTTHSACFGLAALALFAGSAAAQLSVGGTHFHPSHASATAGQSYALSSHTGVGAPLDTLSSGWSNSAGTFVGTVNSWVYGNGGGSTFVYQFVIDPAGTGTLGRATFNGDWALFTIASAGSDSSGTGPVNGNPAWLQHALGGIGIQWTDQQLTGAVGLAPGTHSALVWFHTDASLWQTGQAAVLATGTQAGASVLVPLIPTPSTGVAALLGIGLLASRRRR